MADNQYSITCKHCGASFLSDTFLAFPLCRSCWLMGHRGMASTCWKCRSDYYSADEPFASVDDD